VTFVEAEDSDVLDREWLQNYLERLENCDVCQGHSFLEGLVIVGSTSSKTPTQECLELLRHLGNRWVETRTRPSASRLPDPGPYLLVNKALKSVCRLFDDKQGAFLTTLRPKLDRSVS